MKHEIKVPAVGESVTEATIGSWNKQNGEAVQRNEVVLTLETDKASVEVIAENAGVLQITVQAGTTVPIGTTVGFVDDAATATVSSAAATTSAAAPVAAATATATNSSSAQAHPDLRSVLSPAVQRVVNERGLDASAVEGTGKGGRLTKSDVVNAPAASAAKAAPASAAAPVATKSVTVPSAPKGVSRQGETTRVPMTNIRRRIADRLVQAQHTAAILTTFNEIDMSRVFEIRAKYKDKFKEKYGINLGFMGFFTKAVVEALKAIPELNASIEGHDIIYKHFYNIGVAVGSDKGLIVPILKDVDQMSLAEIEMAIRNYALKARDGKITMDDLSGGTFTISNGGTYGSLMSTPILTPPQVGILGMHKVEDRPVVVDKKIEIRPMMYVAMSYDHRIVDGKEAVTFLVKIKEGVEDPERLLLEI